MITFRSRAGRAIAVLGASALLSGALFAAPFAGGRAHAQWSVCYDDPTVLLSNLTEVDMSATVYDASSDIHTIHYTLTVPAGVHAVAIVNTPSLAGKESFTIVNSSGYHLDTYVTSGSSAPVTAHDILGLNIRTIQGTTNQHLGVTL